MDNRKAYQVSSIVRAYAEEEQLQPAEERILLELESWLATKRMLDIGVGGGRTTKHYAHRVKDYVGGDLSPAMIAACRARFGESSQRSFVVLDATELQQWSAGSFDYVLFSFNGIDEVPAADRDNVFREVSRVLSPEGIFVFSTHNLQTLSRLYSLGHCHTFDRCFKKAIKIILLYLINGSPRRYRDNNFARINDGVHRFRLSLYYTKPNVQLQKLREHGFVSIETYRSDTGDKVDESELSTVDDPWIYFKCYKEPIRSDR